MCQQTKQQPIKIEMEPCWKYINNSLEQQMRHIREESKEIRESLFDGDEEHALEETIDCLQSCITMLGIFKKMGYDIELALGAVKHKNTNRNYYEVNNE